MLSRSAALWCQFLFSDQLCAFLLSIPPNQHSSYRNVQSDDICLDLLSCWWQLAEKKGCTKHKKIICWMRGWAILAGLPHTSVTRISGLRGHVCVCVFFMCMWTCVYHSAHSCVSLQRAQRERLPLTSRLNQHPLWIAFELLSSVIPLRVARVTHVSAGSQSYFLF